MSLLKNPRIKAGTLLVEAIYTIDCLAPQHLQADRFLPATVIRHLLDGQGRDISQAIGFDALCRQCHRMEKPLARKIVSSQKAVLEKLLRNNEPRAVDQARQAIDNAQARMREHQQQELARLKALREKNPAVREEEIRFLERQSNALDEHLANAGCRLEAVRVIVASAGGQ